MHQFPGDNPKDRAWGGPGPNNEPKRYPGGFDEHDLTRARFAAEDLAKKHKRKIGCAVFLIVLLIVLSIVASIAAQFIPQSDDDYEDMGRPDSIERVVG